MPGALASGAYENFYERSSMSDKVFVPPDVHVAQPVWWFPDRSVSSRAKPFAAIAVGVNRRVTSCRIEDYASVAVIKRGVRHIDDPDV